MDGFAPMTGIMPDGMVKFGNDTNKLVYFAEEPLLNPIKSKEAGRPIFDRIEIVHIQQPGERDNIHRMATDADRHNYPDHYRRFKEGAVGEKQMPSGTPIDMLFPNNIEIPPSLKAIKIFTIEQLATLPDVALERVGMGARQWQNQARAYLTYANKGKGYHELDDKIEKMTTEIAVRDQQIASLTEIVRRLEANMQKQTAVLPQPPLIQMPVAGQTVDIHREVAGLERPEQYYASRVAADPIAASGFDLAEFERLRESGEPQDEAVEAEPFSVPEKRGPGRPRKNPQPYTA